MLLLVSSGSIGIIQDSGLRQKVKICRLDTQALTHKSNQHNKVVQMNELPQEVIQMNEQKESSAGNQLARAGAGEGEESCTPMNYHLSTRPSPSTASSGCCTAKEPATLSSQQANSATRWYQDITVSSKPRGTAGSSNASFSSQSQLDSSYSSTIQKKPPSLRNPLLTWTIEELELVSQMRQGMKNTSRRKRAKKPKDAPKRPLR